MMPAQSRRTLYYRGQERGQLERLDGGYRFWKSLPLASSDTNSTDATPATTREMSGGSPSQQTRSSDSSAAKTATRGFLGFGNTLAGSPHSAANKQPREISSFRDHSTHSLLSPKFQPESLEDEHDSDDAVPKPRGSTNLPDAENLPSTVSAIRKLYQMNLVDREPLDPNLPCPRDTNGVGAENLSSTVSALREFYQMNLVDRVPLDPNLPCPKDINALLQPMEGVEDDLETQRRTSAAEILQGYLEGASMTSVNEKDIIAINANVEMLRRAAGNPFGEAAMGSDDGLMRARTFGMASSHNGHTLPGKESLHTRLLPRGVRRVPVGTGLSAQGKDWARFMSTAYPFVSAAVGVCHVRSSDFGRRLSRALVYRREGGAIPQSQPVAISHLDSILRSSIKRKEDGETISHLATAPTTPRSGATYVSSAVSPELVTGHGRSPLRLAFNFLKDNLRQNSTSHRSSLVEESPAVSDWPCLDCVIVKFVKTKTPQTLPRGAAGDPQPVLEDLDFFEAVRALNRELVKRPIFDSYAPISTDPLIPVLVDRQLHSPEPQKFFDTGDSSRSERGIRSLRRKKFGAKRVPQFVKLRRVDPGHPLSLYFCPQRDCLLDFVGRNTRRHHTRHGNPTSYFVDDRHKRNSGFSRALAEELITFLDASCEDWKIGPKVAEINILVNLLDWPSPMTPAMLKDFCAAACLYFSTSITVSFVLRTQWAFTIPLPVYPFSPPHPDLSPRLFPTSPSPTIGHRKEGPAPTVERPAGRRRVTLGQAVRFHDAEQSDDFGDPAPHSNKVLGAFSRCFRPANGSLFKPGCRRSLPDPPSAESARLARRWTLTKNPEGSPYVLASRHPRSADPRTPEWWRRSSLPLRTTRRGRSKADPIAVHPQSECLNNSFETPASVTLNTDLVLAAFVQSPPELTDENTATTFAVSSQQSGEASKCPAARPRAAVAEPVSDDPVIASDLVFESIIGWRREKTCQPF